MLSLPAIVWVRVKEPHVVGVVRRGEVLAVVVMAAVGGGV